MFYPSPGKKCFLFVQAKLRMPSAKLTSAACAAPAACACPCHPPNAGRSVEVNLCSYSQPTKKKKKRSNKTQTQNHPSQAAPEAKIDPTKAAWLARSDELTQTFAASILEFCNLPLDTTRLCINCVSTVCGSGKHT